MNTISTRTVSSLAASVTERAATVDVLVAAARDAWDAVEVAKEAVRVAQAAAMAAEGARSDAQIDLTTAQVAEIAWSLAESHVDDARRCGYQALPSDATTMFGVLAHELRDLGLEDDDDSVVSLVRMLGEAIGELLAVDAAYAAEEAAYHAAEAAL